MKSYKELSRREEKTVRTTVEYVFDDDTTLVVDIPHFFGDKKVDEDYIKLGIENRGITEERALK